MKNFAKILLVVCGVFLLTACGGNKESEKEKTYSKVNCKQVMDDESYVLVASLEDDKVVSISVEATFGSEANAEAFEKFVTFVGETKNAETGVKREGTKVSVSNYAPVIESDDTKVIGESKDTLKEVLMYQNYKCE